MFGPAGTDPADVALEVAQTLALAHREQASVVLVRAPHLERSPFYDLRAEGVRVLSGPAATLALVAAWLLSNRVRRLVGAVSGFDQALSQELKRRLTVTRLPVHVRHGIKVTRQRLEERYPKPVPACRRLFVEPIPLELVGAGRAAAQLRALGVADDARIA